VGDRGAERRRGGRKSGTGGEKSKNVTHGTNPLVEMVDADKRKRRASSAIAGLLVVNSFNHPPDV
jgi:hypothetical protein